MWVVISRLLLQQSARQAARGAAEAWHPQTRGPISHCFKDFDTPRFSSAGHSLSSGMIEALRAHVTFANLHDENRSARLGIQVAQPHMRGMRR
jgi:hypothetical protein